MSINPVASPLEKLPEGLMSFFAGEVASPDRVSDDGDGILQSVNTTCDDRLIPSGTGTLDAP